VGRARDGVVVRNKMLGVGKLLPLSMSCDHRVIDGALAALMLAGRTNSGFPTAGTGYELDAIAAVIIGGASFSGGSGTIAGTAIGVMTIAVLRNGLVLLNVPTEWQTVAIGLVIIGAVYVDVLRQRARK